MGMSSNGRNPIRLARALACGVAALGLNAPGTVLMLPHWSPPGGNNAANKSASVLVYSSRASSRQSGK